MKNKIFAVIFVMLLSINYAHALSASIQPPRMVLRIEAPGTASASIDIFNPNNVTMNVTVTPQGGIEFLTVLNETRFVLEPNETEKVNFDINIQSPGTYNGEIIFAFVPPEGQGIGLASQIIVVANGTAATVPTTTIETTAEPNNQLKLNNPILMIIALAVILGAILLIKRRMK